jgi:hypothetical protein
MHRRTRGRSTGFIITLELILIFTILVIGSLVGVIAVRNALFQLYTAKAQFDVVIGDSSDPQVLVKPVNYDLCEAPQILCKDPGFVDDGGGAPFDPGAPSQGLFALVGIRPERFVSRDRVYFTDANCTGGAYVAFPGDSTLPVGYFNALQGVSYAVGPPENWPCTFGGTCVGVGLLYRNAEDTPPGAPVDINSVWTSLNPDCYLHSGGTDPVVYSDPPEHCEDLTGDGFTTDNLGVPGLLLAEEVIEEDGANVLDKFTPLMAVVLPTVTEVTVTDAVAEDAPLQVGPGDPITETGQPTMEDAGAEDAPPN